MAEQLTSQTVAYYISVKSYDAETGRFNNTKYITEEPNENGILEMRTTDNFDEKMNWVFDEKAMLPVVTKAIEFIKYQYGSSYNNYQLEVVRKETKEYETLIIHL